MNWMKTALCAVALAVPMFGFAESTVAQDDDDFMSEYIDEASQLRHLVKRGDIFLVSSTDCGICSWARGWMEAHRIPHGECFIEEDVKCLDTFKQLRKTLKVRGTPVTLVRNRPMEGFDPEKVLASMQDRVRK